MKSKKSLRKQSFWNQVQKLYNVRKKVLLVQMEIFLLRQEKDSILFSRILMPKGEQRWRRKNRETKQEKEEGVWQGLRNYP